MGVIPEICSTLGWKYIKRSKKEFWTLELCKDEAKKHKTQMRWKINSGPSHYAALKNGWIEECCRHMQVSRRPVGYWTLGRCKKEAFNYNSIIDWKNNDIKSYNAAAKMKWLNECTKHMKK